MEVESEEAVVEQHAIAELQAATQDVAQAPVMLRQIRHAAMDLLARREHGAAELVVKLARRFSDREAVLAVLEALRCDGLQSDVRFAASFARYRSARGQGPLRIEQELLQRGLAAETIRTTLSELECDWDARAGAVFKKKYGDPNKAPNDAKSRAKQIRFLSHRGFSYEHFQMLLR